MEKIIISRNCIKKQVDNAIAYCKQNYGLEYYKRYASKVKNGQHYKLQLVRSMRNYKQDAINLQIALGENFICTYETYFTYTGQCCIRIKTASHVDVIDVI
jgi:hypothetical protein